MSALHAQFPGAAIVPGWPSLTGLCFASHRLACGRALVIFSFVWPFFNYKLLDPANTIEINFLPVFLAALLLPEVALRQRWSILLAVPVFAVAFAWASPATTLRLAVAILPLHFILNLTRRLRECGQQLIPPNLSYVALIAFVAFSIVQTVHLRLVSIIPESFTQLLVAVLPRYMEVPYDESGIRGVQGWASEPSGAALTCMAFAIVAIVQRPERRWRILLLYILLLLTNKSVYALLLTVLLGLGCLATLRRGVYSLIAALPIAAAGVFYVQVSTRFAELRTNLLISGLSGASNRELTRIVQIAAPLQQLPHIYHPVILIYDGQLMPMEPLGLLPLLIGYGGVFGFIWLIYHLRNSFALTGVPQRDLGLIACLVLLVLAPADLIPSVVALAMFAVRDRRTPGEQVARAMEGKIHHA